MNFKTKTLLLFLSIIFLQTHTSERLYEPTVAGKLFGWASQSKVVCLFNKYITSKTRGFIKTILGDDAASQEYQDLGKKAQLAVGISEENVVPIKKIPPTSPFKIVGGLAEPDTIYVNEEKFKQRSYGVKYCALLHESIHKKYNDVSVDAIVEIPTMILSGICAYKFIKAIKPVGRFKVLHILGTVVTSFFASFIATKILSVHRECRADTEGHYAAQCSVCVQESADRRKELEKEKNIFLASNSGYLTSSELEEIANNLAAHKKICAYHQDKEHGK